MGPVISDATHARILRAVAARALGDARAAWRQARSSSTEDTVRGAYRASVLAARTLRRAADVTPDQAGEMLAAAGRVDVAAAGLLDQLVRIAP